MATGNHRSWVQGQLIARPPSTSRPISESAVREHIQRAESRSADREAARYLYLVAKRYAEGDKRTDARDVEIAYREWFAQSRDRGQDKG